MSFRGAHPGGTHLCFSGLWEPQPWSCTSPCLLATPKWAWQLWLFHKQRWDVCFLPGTRTPLGPSEGPASTHTAIWLTLWVFSCLDEFWFSDGSLSDKSKCADPGLMPLPDTATGLDWTHLVDAARAFEGKDIQPPGLGMAMQGSSGLAFGCSAHLPGGKRGGGLGWDSGHFLRETQACGEVSPRQRDPKPARSGTSCGLAWATFPFPPVFHTWNVKVMT